VYAIRDDLTELLSGLIAYVDFDEDDELPYPEQLPALNRIKNAMDALHERSHTARFAREGLLTVIVGKPNVGKSTLFNALLATDRAIVTPYPGTTRDTLQEWLVLDGRHYALCDTAGLRKGPDPIEEEGIRRAHGKIGEADLIIVVCDGSTAPDAEDAAVLDECRTRPAIIVVNKADLPPACNPRTALGDTSDAPVLSISAAHGLGLDALRRELIELGRALVPGARDEEARGGLSPRASHLLEAAALPVQRLLDSCATAGAPMPPDMMIMELESVLALLGQITGDTADEAVLDRVFERFCVGK
jgi:tRNA modification GTPase